MYDASVFDVPPLSMDGRVRQDLLLMVALFGRCDWSVVGALEILPSRCLPWFAKVLMVWIVIYVF